ncbi:MAG TPA: hypothetical protein VLX68_17365 [Chitinivibrionales bacterium]|nr:hypothetical protein [Chitinivibrionales bacterium]
MNRKFAVILLVMCTIACSFVFAQNVNKKTEKPKKKSVLIVRDSSGLEIAVTRILNDSLSKLGCRVKEAELSNIKKENASSYKISIVFSAIKAGNEVDPRIQNFISSKADTLSKVFLFTVYGGLYDEQGKKVDATTEATKALHPDLIARQILRSVKPAVLPP